MSKEQPTPSDRDVRWNDVLRRLELARASTERAWTPDREKVSQVLKARARALAREPEETADGEGIDLLEFQIARETYAVESVYVREVQRLENLTPIPCTPPFVLGIVSLRGEILSVIDLEQFCGLSGHAPDDRQRIIVLQSETMSFAIVVDAIVGALRLPPADIRTLDIATTLKHVRGITDRGTIVLDAPKLLLDRRIVVDEGAESRTAQI